jgi:probable HAF family extracellular repeat protein
MEDLNTLGGNDAGLLDLIGVVAINERGQVAACSYTDAIANPTTGTPTLDPFLWEHGSMRDLGTLGGTSGCATALNNSGQVAGYSNLQGDLIFHAFVSDREKLKDLGTLGGDKSVALAINDAGHVIGRADVTALCTACAPGNQQQLHHPFLWKDSLMIDLGVIAGDTAGSAYSINSKGQVVGTSIQCTQINSDDSCDGPVSHGFLWEDGSLFSLQSLIDPGSKVTVNNVTSINDRGEIAGTGMLANGEPHAYLLVPCGEGNGACDSAANATDKAVGLDSLASAEVFTGTTAKILSHHCQLRDGRHRHECGKDRDAD